ncbi:hypothetical protein CFC21_010518 [Triticum aestivum]|uniref:Uncharacterized protein n=2 Tax=Triticum aestivum TaxID=4565 RepID=A0A3B5ZQ66_WHEAT|nr:uncharacterized protein LOC123165541 [Triticum aestivum]KAF6993656.1 hypothetical protein CFC21_010518 [Triticum aestivum]
MGSWKRTITTPFRKACTMLSPQHGGGRSDDQHGGSGHDGKKTPRTRHHLKRSGAAGAAAMAQGEVVESPSTTAQLYGDVMACAYEDVQVMWSMLDNKAKVLDTTAS